MTIASTLLELLMGVSHTDPAGTKSSVRQFIPAHELCEKDSVIIDMLNSKGHEDVCFCICDPNKMDMPIIFASQGFCNFTGYANNEIEGRNCRFLQGEGTAPDDVAHIRSCLEKETEGSINLLNYRKDGTPFVNEFFLAPLRDAQGKVCYYIGVQCEVEKLGPGQAPKNPGWVYTQGNHV